MPVAEEIQRSDKAGEENENPDQLVALPHNE